MHSPFFYVSESLRHLNSLGTFLLFLSQLRHGNSQYTILNLGRNLVTLHIIRQCIGLFVVRVAELATQIVMMLILLFVFNLILDSNGKVTIFVDTYTTIFFLNAWSCKFHGVGLFTLLDIDCGCCTVGIQLF